MTPAARRRLLRWLFYPVAGLLLAGGLALFFYLRSGRPERFLAEELRRRLDAQLGGPCDFQSLTLEYLPPTAVVTGLTCEHPRLTVARAEAALELSGLLHGRAVVNDLDLFDPEVTWDVDAEQLPERAPSAAPSVPTPRRFTLRRMRIHGGSVAIGSERRDLSADLHDLLLSADNGADPSSTSAFYAGPWDGTASFARGTLRFGDFQLSGIRGAVSFGVDSGGAHTRQLRLKAEDVDITGTGEIKAGNPPHLTMNLSAGFSPQSAALVHPLPQITADRIQADAVIEESGRGLHVNGAFTAAQPVLDPDRHGPEPSENGPMPPWRAETAEGTFSYAGGVVEAQANLARFAGGGAVVRYKTELPAENPARPGGLRRHNLSVIAEDLLLAEALAGLGKLPGREQVAPTALVSGRINMSWEAGQFEQVTGSADLALSALPGDLPASGNAALSWRGRNITVRSADLTLPGGRLSGSGLMDFSSPAARYDVELDLDADDIAALASFVEKRWDLAPAGVRPALSLGDLSGPVHIKATISGTDPAPRARGTFSAHDLVVRLPVAGAADTPGARLPLVLDHAEGSFDVGPDRLLVEVPRLESGLMTARLRAEVPPAGSPQRWTVTLGAAHAPAGLVARLLGQPEMADRAGGTVDVTSTLAAGLNGSVTLESSDLSLYGVSLQPARASARLRDGKMDLEQVSCALFGGTLSAGGSVDLGRQPAVGQIDLRAEGLGLEQAGSALGHIDLRGAMNGKGRIRIGTITTTDGTFIQQGVSVSGMDLGTLNGRWSGPLERLHIEFEDDHGDLRAAGDLIRQRGDPVTGDPDLTVTLVEATVEVQRLSLDEVRPLLPAAAPQGLDGEADGVVTIRGPLNAPELIELHAIVERLALQAGDVLLQNQDPMVITLSDQYLTLAATRLTGERTDLRLAGSVSLSGSHDITARLDGSFDLGLLQLMYPSMRASGPCTAALRFVEREDQMTYTGTLDLSGGRIAHPGLPMPIDNLSGHGAFDEKGVLHLTDLRGTLGGGQLVGSGQATFEGASMPRAHLAVRGLGVRAEILTQLRAFFDADVTLDKEGPVWRMAGLAQIQRAVYERAFGVSASGILARGREFQPGGSSTRERPATVLLDFDIIAENNVWIRNKDALIEASAHLRLEGTLDHPQISGNISALEGGTFRFRDVTYTVRGGSLDFADPTQIDPMLDIKAGTQVQHYEILLSVGGKFSKPSFELTSEPALPQRDIVWLLLTGHTLSDNTSPLAQTAAESQIAAYLAAPVAGAISGAALAPLEKLPGIYSVSIDPYFLNGTADPSARLTITTRMTNALLFTASTHLGSAGAEVYQVEYNPGRIWDLIGTRDADGSLTADLRWRRRFRAGPVSESDRPAILPPGNVTVGSLKIVADHMPGSEGALRRRLSFEEGDSYARGDLLEGREALRLYYVKRGYPAVRVELIDEAPDDDPLRHQVSYLINAGPEHELVFSGVNGSHSMRSAVRDAWKEPILFEDPAQEARAATELELKNAGYYKAQVGATTHDESPALRQVRLDVAPGQKVKVRSIRVRGNASMPEERILRQMLTREDGFFTRGLLKEKVLAEDAASIRSLYQASGYLDAVVPPPSVTFTADGREADIVVSISEGSLSIVSALRFVDDAGVPVSIPELPDEALTTAAKLKTGQVAAPVEISEAADRVREALDAKGYSHPVVTYALIGPPEATDVIFTVTAGEMLRVRRVRVDGNTLTRTTLIKKEVTLKEGDRLSRAALLDIQRRLYGLGVFRAVHIVAEPVASAPGYADVHVSVQDGPHIMTGWGVGYNTENLLGASFELGDNNVFGTRRSAALFLRGSSRDWRVQVSLRDPNLLGEKIETLLTGFIERQESESFTTNRRALTFQLNRKINEQLRLFGGYRIEDVDLVDLQISPSQTGLQTARIGSIGGAVTWDTRNDLLNPRRGGLISLELNTAHPGLISEVTFDRTYASMSHFVALGRKVVLATSLRAGFLFSKDDSQASERFFAGGDTTLRGFGHNQVGPQDPNTGEPIGGDSLLLFNEELRFPVWKSLQGVTFFDAGNVYRESSDFDPSDLRAAAGLGLRLNTPVGPFRVEYGWKLDREPGESRGEFFFSIGQAF